MSTIKAKRSFPAGGCAAGLALLAAVTLAADAGNAGSRRSEIEHRQRMLQNSEDAANQRTLQQRDIADKQRQLLDYQIRKNKRMQMKMQCKAAGGGLAC
jgi:hypothetical protein